MTGANPRSRATIVLGVISVASFGFLFVRNDFRFVVLTGSVAGVFALALGALAIAAGLLTNRKLTLLSGVAFLAAATLVLVQLIVGSQGFLHPNPSVMSLWLGLGAALVAIGLTPQQEVWR